MRFGYWMPVFGGWLRNVRDEGMSTDWPYIRDLAVDSERQGFDLTLIAELNLNDIKGHRAPSLDCWTLAPPVADREGAVHTRHDRAGPGEPQRGVLVVAGRGGTIRCRLRRARRPLRTDAGVARC